MATIRAAVVTVAFTTPDLNNVPGLGCWPGLSAPLYGVLEAVYWYQL